MGANKSERVEFYVRFPFFCYSSVWKRRAYPSILLTD
jgi:hypothetical protein